MHGACKIISSFDRNNLQLSAKCPQFCTKSSKQLKMKKILFLLGAFVFGSVAYSQSILTEKEKYEVVWSQSTIGYEANVPLLCGDGETKKSVKVYYRKIDSLNNQTADSLYQISLLILLNEKAKNKCKNTYSWKPSTIRISNGKLGISAIVEGSAENTYGSRGVVEVYFKRKNGEFIEL